MPRLGSLGTHSRGKVEEGDRGDLRLAVTVERGIIRVDFGTELTWMGMDAGEARALAAGLLRAADDLEGRS